MILGVTGSIGCGKSTVLGLFRSASWRTADADAICRGLYDDPEGFGNAALLGMRAVRGTVLLDCGDKLAESLAGKIKGGDILTLMPTGDILGALPELIEIIKNMGLDIVPTYKMLYN